MHPNVFPTLRCRPDFVNGTPILLEIFDFAEDTPKARLKEKPPFPIIIILFDLQVFFHNHTVAGNGLHIITNLANLSIFHFQNRDIVNYKPIVHVLPMIRHFY